MNIIEITKENTAAFADILGDDLTVDMGRSCFRGFGALDELDRPRGAIVFELFGADQNRDTTSRIRLLEGESDEIKDELKDAYAGGVREIEISESFYATPDNVLAEYLEHIGFSKDQTESKEIVLSLSDIENLPIKLSAKIPPYVMNLSRASVIQYRNFIKRTILKGNKGSVEDLAYLPRSWFDGDISSCVVTDEKLDGIFLIRKTPSGELHTALYVAYGPDYIKNLGFMLVNTINSAILKYPPATKVVINRHNVAVKKLTGKLLHGFTGSEEFSGKRTE